MRSIIRRALVILALAGAVTACNGGLKTASEKLRDASFSFNEDVRWQRFRVAARALPPQRREAWIAAMQRAATAFRVVDFELRPVSIGDTRALVEVDLTYYRYPALTIEQQRRRQDWRYADGVWTLVGDTEYVPPPGGELPDKMPELLSPNDPAVAPGSDTAASANWR
jgi:hypothetical protein